MARAPSIKRTHILWLLVVAAALIAYLAGQSHVNAQRNRAFEKGLLQSFREHYPALTHVDFSLFRSAPTQVGSSVPKYYLWVSLREGDAVIAEGAVRGALDIEAFYVLQFIPREDIVANPKLVESVFPAALAADIQARAAPD